MITLITLTGGRPELFRLLELFMKRQTHKDGWQWIVVDDFSEPTKCTMGQNYVRGPREWAPGLNTQRYNMEEALKHVQGEWVFFPEDDDYFAPTYIDTMLRHLKLGVMAAGVGNAKYYHATVPGYKYLRNYVHAALSMTAIHRSLLPYMVEAVNSGEFYFDSFLWRKILNNRIPFTIINNTTLSVGFKGLPGRAGLTHSHREKKDYLYDAKHVTLKRWLGSDYNLYVPHLRSANRGGANDALNSQRKENTKIDASALRPKTGQTSVLR